MFKAYSICLVNDANNQFRLVQKQVRNSLVHRSHAINSKYSDLMHYAVVNAAAKQNWNI